jgi:hypothetical protein
MDSADSASVSPVALAALVILIGLTWALPRRFAACPLLIMTCLMPLGQDLVVGGLHFHLFRVILFVGLMRVVAKGETRLLKLGRADKLMLAWVIVVVVLGTLSKPSMELLTNRLGDVYNAICCYFFIRCVVVDLDDVFTCVKTLALLSVPVAALMILERMTDHNPFAMLGGVPELSPIRNGHVRCQGAFRHAILAGTFGATQAPLFIALWFQDRKYRLLALVSFAASMIIVVTANSSGALMTLLAGIAGMCLWKWRTQMRWLRRGSVVVMLCLAMVMQAPVWYVFARLSSVSGGEGWHRAFVIDQAVNHFSEWWLFGTTYTAHWAPGGQTISTDSDMMDITNQFVMEGVKGGIFRLILFVWIIVVCFKSVGRRIRAEVDGFPKGLLVWALGVSLFGHCLSFMSVPYFDQMIVIWYWIVAVTATVQNMPETEAPQEGARDNPNEQDAELAHGW